MPANLLHRVVPHGPQQAPLVWSRSKASSDNLVAVSGVELVVGTLKASRVAETTRAIQGGRPISDVLGAKALRIAIFAIAEVRSVSGQTSLQVRYDRGSNKFVSVRVWFDSYEDRDDAFDALQQRLGPRVEIERRQPGRLRAMLPPLVLCVLLAAFGAAFYHISATAFGVTPTRPVVGRGAIEAWRADRQARFSECPPLANLSAVGVFLCLATATMLKTFGYTVSGAILLASSGAALCIAVTRFFRPPCVTAVRSAAD